MVKDSDCLAQEAMMYLLIALLLSFGAVIQRSPDVWHDRSPHQVRFVTIEEGVRLEVLDWGGTGRPLVLLAGLGNTAHIFDDFALKLNKTNHVYGITRRGYGMSSHPDSGYNGQRLADDVIKVIESLGLVSTVLAGHSIAGEELTAIGAQHSNRIGGLIYLDALSDPTTDWSDYNALLQKLPSMKNPPPRPPRGETNPTFQAWLDWQKGANGYTFPEAELHNVYEALPDGRMSFARTPVRIGDAIRAQALKPDYAKIRVPVLALIQGSPSIEERLSEYMLTGDQDRLAVERFWNMDKSYWKKFILDLKNGVPGARVIELPHPDHFVFFADQAQVLREMGTFLAGLDSRRRSRK
jgi:pimeloyl-ACP methyl ester carboxylesterase